MHKRNRIVKINHGPVIGESTINSKRLMEYKEYIESTSRICPRPWYWARFFFVVSTYVRIVLVNAMVEYN